MTEVHLFELVLTLPVARKKSDSELAVATATASDMVEVPAAVATVLEVSARKPM